MAQTLYWHDYETFGLDPARDRPAQFAGIRTDFDLNPIGEPLRIYCKPPADYLPHPESCLVTGISPYFARQQGVCEAHFIKSIHSQLAQAETCTVGYNNLRFDDEVTRNCLYRNFFDPYTREWQNGNSRWDILDLVRAARSLRPEGINWPNYEDGTPNFRLEFLTAANGLKHDSAHDALSDVEATIAFARLIKTAQPKLFDFVFTHRSKNKALSLLKLGSMQPLLHVSGMYPSIKGNIALVIPLCKHPTNNNGIMVYDLSVDPEPLLDLSPKKIHERVFTATEDLPEGVQRIPLKTVHINKCPVLAPLSVLRKGDASKLEIDLNLCRKHLKKIEIRHKGITQKLQHVFTQTEFEPPEDPDLMIYSGGFFNEHDKKLIQKIRQCDPEKLNDLHLDFEDARLDTMLFRYKARNFPEILSDAELESWRQQSLAKLTEPNNSTGLILSEYHALLSELKEASGNAEMLKELERYADELIKELAI